MADKIVPKPEVADDLSKLLAALKKTASADCAKGADTPDEAQAVDQGKKAGSNVADAKLQAADLNNANAQAVLEIGDDPSKAKDGPSVKESSADGIEELTQSGENMVVKEAAALADELEALDKKLLHLAAAEVVAELAVRHQAEMEEQAIAEAVPELQEALDLDPETAQAVAAAVLSGEIPQEDLVEAIEQNQYLKTVAEATGAPQEEILQFADEIGQEAETSGRPVEEVVQGALQALQHQAMSEMKETYNQSAALMKKASAEGDEFTASMAKRQMQQIEAVLDQIGAGHIAGCGETVPKKAEEGANEDAKAPAADTSAADEDTGAAVEAAEDESTEAAADAGADAAAAGMAEGVAPDQMQVQIVQDAIQTLIDEGVDPAVIAQAVQERMSGQMPDLSKVASAEDLEKDHRLLSHVAIDMACRKAASIKD
jgi:hypothetical protein